MVKSPNPFTPRGDLVQAKAYDFSIGRQSRIIPAATAKPHNNQAAAL
jgi:hypothetical protein